MIRQNQAAKSRKVASLSLAATENETKGGVID